MCRTDARWRELMDPDCLRVGEEAAQMLAGEQVQDQRC